MYTSAFRHVCYDRGMFKTYNVVEDKKVLLEDSHTTVVAGIRDVELKFAFGSNFERCDAYFRDERESNFRILLNKTRFTQTTEVDLFVHHH